MRSKILEKLESICHNYGINALYVFGSRTKEIADFINGKVNIDKGCNADVDLGILPASDSLLTPRDKIKAALAFEDLLMVSRIDLMIMSEASPFLCLDIIERRATLYIRP